MTDTRRSARNIRWIGGGSASGKSTVAALLADRHGLTVYSSDDTMLDHARRIDAASAPHLHRFLSQTMDERWLGQTPDEMVATFHWFRGEAFDCIVDDLAEACASGVSVIAEGFRLLPRLVAQLLESPTHAVWLLPTPAFRQRALAARGSTWAIAGQTSDPQQALANLLVRDGLFTDRLRREVTRLGLRSIEVDGSEGITQIADRAEAILEL